MNRKVYDSCLTVDLTLRAIRSACAADQKNLSDDQANNLNQIIEQFDNFKDSLADTLASQEREGILSSMSNKEQDIENQRQPMIPQGQQQQQPQPQRNQTGSGEGIIKEEKKLQDQVNKDLQAGVGRGAPGQQRETSHSR